MGRLFPYQTTMNQPTHGDVAMKKDKKQNSYDDRGKNGRKNGLSGDQPPTWACRMENS